jgi:hypothetical protein
VTRLSETGSDVTSLSTRRGSDRFSILYARFTADSFSENTDFGKIIKMENDRETCHVQGS